MINIIKEIRKKRSIANFEKDIQFKVDFIPLSKHNKVYEQKIEKKESYKVAFVIPGMYAHSGGHTSILRLGTYLEETGNSVTYITYDETPVKEMEINAGKNLSNYKGRFVDRNGIKDNYDIIVATFWNSCYFILDHQENFGYKMYFIQDYEPYFFRVGDYYMLAKQTYLMGFHMVSLGAWNSQIIAKEIDKEKIFRLDHIEFPVELNQYKILKRVKRNNKKLKIAVYIKFDDKRAPYLLLRQLQFLSQEIGSDKIEINIFGLDKEIKLPIGNNLGKLSHNQLIELYSSSDFGIVGSLTNISLINYEMSACGLPVIDFKQGSAPAFFTEKEMIFIDAQIDSLHKAIESYLKNESLLDELVGKAQLKLTGLTWGKSAAEFNNIINKIK